MNTLWSGRTERWPEVRHRARRTSVALGRVQGFQPALLRDRLEASGLTVDALAVATDVTSQAVRGWLNGSYKPSAEAVRSLGEALGVDPLTFSGKTLVTATLVDLRQRSGLTGAEAAEAAGLNPSQVYTLEQSVTPPKLDHLDALADVYAVEISDIRRGWLNRRIERFGRESLGRLSSDMLDELEY